MPQAVALLALVGAALLGAVLLWGPQQATPRELSPETRFVREMIQHHVQAVDMATRIRDRSQDRTLRSLALDIQLSQTEQIGQMRGWLTLWRLPWGGVGMTAKHARMMGMATPQEVAALDTLPLAEAERRFLQLMIRHHQGAVAMVDPVLNTRVRPEVSQLARQIASTQGAELRTMTDLLTRRGGSVLPAPDAAGPGGSPGVPDTDHHH